jgi:hypothetical protein
METTVGQFPVDLGLEDDLRWMTVMESHNLVDVTEEGPVKHAGGQHGSVDAIVDGLAGALDLVVTRSLLMISPRSLIVACWTSPMGAMTACRIWRAAAGGRGSCQLCRTSACIIFSRVGAHAL